MKAVIQTVEDAVLTVDGVEISALDRGMLVYFGVEAGDSEEVLAPFLSKLMKLRIFKDVNGKMNLSLSQSGGGILFVSQFTLAGEIYRGNRPGFETAARPEVAESLCNKAVQILTDEGYDVKTGVFGAHMKVSYTNDGPETFILESEKISHKKPNYFV